MTTTRTTETQPRSFRSHFTREGAGYRCVTPTRGFLQYCWYSETEILRAETQADLVTRMILLPPPPTDGYHLTEVGALSTVGRSHNVPVGEHPATDLTAYHYVAPAAYVEEWCRRMAHEYGAPASDAGLKAAVEAHRRGDPLPPAEWADWPAWVPPSTLPPKGAPAFELLPRRRRAAARG